MNISIKNTFVLFLTLLVLGLSVYFLFYSDNSVNGISEEKLLKNDGSIDFPVFTQTMRAEISKTSSTKIYKDFKELLKDFDFSTRHTAAHIFGALLYQEKGLDSLPTCDASFGFGCYHGFFGEALAELGGSSIEKLDKVCIKKYGPLGTGCQHGIGHGVLEYFGTSKLSDALVACGESTQVNEHFGCTSGVFMEYFLPVKITATTTTSEVRTYNDSDPHGPCDEVSSEFKKSCYYEIGRWWGRALEGDYSKMGKLCSQVNEDTSMESCFLGLGHAAAIYTQTELQKTIEACNKMPSLKGETLCKSGASWAFFAQANKPDQAPKICESLPKDSRSECVTRSDLIESGRIIDFLSKEVEGVI